MRPGKIEVKEMSTIIKLNKLVIPTLLGFLMILMAGCTREAPLSQPPITGPVVVMQSGGAGLLISECRDKQYIVSMADYIIEGMVERVESGWNEDMSGIFTTTNLSIEKYIKGTPFTENELQIVTPGGTVGDITQLVEDQSIFHEGKRVRIYFQEVDGEFHIVCAQFGVEDLELISPSPSH
jgi:hypothetical protein